MGLMYGEGSENTRKERERKEVMGRLSAEEGKERIIRRELEGVEELEKRLSSFVEKFREQSGREVQL